MKKNLQNFKDAILNEDLIWKYTRKSMDNVAEDLYAMVDDNFIFTDVNDDILLDEENELATELAFELFQESQAALYIRQRDTYKEAFDMLMNQFQYDLEEGDHKEFNESKEFMDAIDEIYKFN